MSRIALVSPYALSVFGGVQEQVLAMSRELARRGDEVLVLAPDASDHTPYDTPARIERFGGLVSMPANGSRAPLTLSPRAARGARRALEAFAPDVVHFHEPFAPLVGWSILLAHEVPAVATFHRSGDGPALRLTRPLLGRLARCLDGVVSVSDAAASTIAPVVTLEMRVLFNGFETERFVEHPRERSTTPVVLVLGRLEERKGVAYAIEAVRAHNARTEHPWRLVIVGDGPQRRSLEVLAGRDEMVLFTGALSDDQKRMWLRHASVFVAPALRGESFGLVLLEAMASEVAVVASDIVGYRDAAANLATLVAPGDPGALGRAIEASLAREEPARIAAARAHAEHWSMASLVDAYELVYDSAREHFARAR